MADDLDPRLAEDLKAVFADEADEAGMDRLLAALEGDRAALSDQDRADLAAYDAVEAAWVDAAPSGRRARPVMVGLALAAAAALVLAMLAREGPPPAADAGLAIKGDPQGFSLHVTVARDGTLRPVTPGLRLRTGDQIGLAYTAATGGHLRVFAVDAGGQVTALHPLDGDTRAAAGARISLPAGARVTPGQGCEWIVGVQGDVDFDAARVEAALRRGYAARNGCALGPLGLPALRVDAVEIRR